MPEFTIQSNLNVDPNTFWAATSMQSVNWELAPIVRMTAPPEWTNCPLEQWEAGRDLFKSWVLLFGIIPVDRHSFRLREIIDGVGFRESSSSWINRRWNHDRTVVAREAGCTVTDHVAVAGRVPILRSCLMPVYKLVFRHRHRRLRRKYGTLASAAVAR
jgi:hypothetical protein